MALASLNEELEKSARLLLIILAASLCANVVLAVKLIDARNGIRHYEQAFDGMFNQAQTERK